jgi:hypothetical protein
MRVQKDVIKNIMYNLLNKNGIKLARDRRERAAANYKS